MDLDGCEGEEIYLSDSGFEDLICEYSNFFPLSTRDLVYFSGF